MSLPRSTTSGKHISKQIKDVFKNDDPRRVLALFHSIPHSLMTAFLYNAAIHAYGTLNDWRSALDLYFQMKNNGVKPNERTLVSLITILGKFGQPDEALAVFQDCELPNARYYDAFVCTLGCCGKWKLCCQVFDEMLDCDRSCSTCCWLWGINMKAFDEEEE
jgi:pentatricopeptide repeat protein